MRQFIQAMGARLRSRKGELELELELELVDIELLMSNREILFEWA